MKILFVWTGVTSYMADCWRKLQQMPGVELKVVVELVESGKEFDREKVLKSLDTCVVNDWSTDQRINGPTGQEAIALTRQRANGPTGQEAIALTRQRANELTGQEAIAQFFGEWKPDVMFAVGWHSKVVRAMVGRTDWRDIPKVCCSDMPWRWQLRCFAARFVLRRYLRQFYGMMVPGKSGYMYARWLGFPKERVFTGQYGIDVGRFQVSSDRLQDKGGAGRFLYLGRFSPEKRLDVLMRAYDRYRERGGSWELDLYGAGRLPEISVKHCPDVCSFVQPAEISGLYASHACLTMASDFDPWPLVVLECCASGRPIIVTDRCTNHYEFVKANGLIVKHGDVDAMAAAMLRMEREYGAFRNAAETEGRAAAANYSCAAWCERIKKVCDGARK